MTAPLPTPVLPYGLRRVMLTAYTDQTCTALASPPVRLPIAQTLSFKESEDFNDLQGDDETAATHGSGPTVSWELDAGGISLEAWAIITGGVVGTPDTMTKYLKKNINTQRPYFKIEGQSISDSGGDIHCEIFRAKMTDDMEGEFGYGEFVVSKCQGVGYGSLMTDPNKVPPLEIGDLYQFTQNRNVTAIPDIGAPTNLASGAITTTDIPLTWGAVDGADTYHVYFKESSTTDWTLVDQAQVTGTTATVDGLTADTTYDIRVCGVDANGEGMFAYLTGVQTLAA